MGSPMCKIFSHGPMSRAIAPLKVLFGTYSHKGKVQYWGQGGHGPGGSLDPLL